MFSRDPTVHKITLLVQDLVIQHCVHRDNDDQRSFCDYTTIFLILSFIKKVNFNLMSHLACLLFIIFQLCSTLPSIFCVVFMPELQEAFPMLIFIHLLGGVSVDLKADTHQIRNSEHKRQGQSSLNQKCS